MSVSDTAVAAAAARRPGAPLVRDAVPADYPAIRHVIIAAYRQYADLIARGIFSPYLADVLDLDKHARHGRLLVVEADGRIRGFGAFYRDAGPGVRLAARLGRRARTGRPPGRARARRRARPARRVRAPRPGFRRAGVRVPHGQLHDRRHRPIRAARLPPGARVRLRNGRPLQPVRRRADHVDRLPAPAGAGARRVRVISLSGGF